MRGGREKLGDEGPRERLCVRDKRREHPGGEMCQSWGRRGQRRRERREERAHSGGWMRPSEEIRCLMS